MGRRPAGGGEQPLVGAEELVVLLVAAVDTWVYALVELHLIVLKPLGTPDGVRHMRPCPPAFVPSTP